MIYLYYSILTISLILSFSFTFYWTYKANKEVKEGIYNEKRNNPK